MKNAQLERGGLLLAVMTLVSCGGGGGGSSPALVAPMLRYIALAPLNVSLAPGATQQLTVTGTYSNGTTQTLPASGETFSSSNTSVATVSAAGLITVDASAAATGTATISATDTASGLVSAAAASTVVTVAAAVADQPTPTSASAAQATVTDNAACQPAAVGTAYYWEIGDATGLLIAGVASDAAHPDTNFQNSGPITRDSLWPLASASKWIYATYVVESLGAGAFVDGSSTSIPYMNFTSGYTQEGDYPPKGVCDATSTVDSCISTLPAGTDPTTVGRFDYDSEHMEIHAQTIMGLGADGIHQPNSLTAAIDSVFTRALGANAVVVTDFSIPLLAGGMDSTAAQYALMLSGIVAGKLQMSKTLTTSVACTNWNVAGCNAVVGSSPITNASLALSGSPIGEAWGYSLGHWVESDPTVGDGASSSPGSLGFYPWIDKQNKYYGMIARAAPVADAGAGTFQGYLSAECGRLIRNAWETGVEQKGATPVLVAGGM